MSPRTYILSVVTIGLIMMAASGIVNGIVDPYGYFRWVDRVGFNHEKPVLKGFERLVKASQFAARRPEAVIVGSSLADIGFSPRNAALTRNGKWTAYNLGIAGAKWPEVYCNALFAMNQPTTRRVVLGVSGTEAADCGQLALGKPNWAKLLFSVQSLQSSLQTLKNQQGGPYVTPEGLWFGRRYDPKVKNDEDIARNFRSFFRGWQCDARAPRPAPVTPSDIDRTPLTAAQGEGLRQLISLAKDRHIELTLVLYPQHVLASEIGRFCKGGAPVWQSLWQVAALLSALAPGDTPDDAAISLWDFRDYHPLNGERVWLGIAPSDRLWQEASHFNIEVGDAALNAMFAGASGYGHRVTPESFNDLVLQRETERLAYLSKHPEVMEEMRRIVGPTVLPRLSDCLSGPCGGAKPGNLP